MIIFLFFVFISISTGQQVHVTTSKGPVLGYHFDQGNNKSAIYYGQADIFLGIPFVQPPVGSLRYKKPQKLTQFPQSPYNATFHRPECPQGTYDAKNMNEDCLYLNIYTPNASSSEKYPIMIWIHGGSYMSGNNRINIPGTVRNFVSRGVVVVSIQYRLGFLGFFTSFTEDFPPNLGMLDQVESFRFVKEEISNFGGDPNKVTIWGESAGGASVSAHSYSPLSKDLFQQGIQESGAVLTNFEDALGPTDKNYEYAQVACNFTMAQWNSGNFDALKTCLYNLDVSDGLKHEREIFGVDSSYGNTVCWTMVQDDYFFPGVPKTLSKNRPNKPVITGTNRDEWALWETWRISRKNSSFTDYTKSCVESYLKTKFANFFGSSKNADDVMKVVENLYLDPRTLDDDHLAWLKFTIDVGTAWFFTGFTAQDAELYLQNNNLNVYVYEFTYSKENYENTGYHPVQHASELNWVFMSGWNEKNTNETDIKLANFFGESWTNFAKTGKPTLDNSWNPTLSKGLTSMEYFEISPNGGMKSGYRILDRIQFNRVLPMFVGQLPQNLPDYNNGSIVRTF